MSNIIYKEILKENIDYIHTTELGFLRIQRNLNIYDDPVLFTINVINNNDSKVTKNGKNYYVSLNNIVITINASSYTIITAQLV